MLGAEQSHVLLDALANQLAQLPTDIAGRSRAERLAREAHSIVSSAGLLGFAALSDLARRVEAGYEAGIDLAPLWPARRDASRLSPRKSSAPRRGRA